SLPDHYLEEVQQRYSSRRDFLIDEFASLGWTVEKPQATMYLWVPCPPDMTSTDFALTVLQETGVVVTPGNAFGPGGEGYIRVSLIAERDRLAVAMDRIRQAGFRFAPAAAAAI
ncbi:LL-diaminopimelate aminotransferase, partial [filamentous cyanobacterium CCP4]